MAYARIDEKFYMTPKNALMDRDEQDLYLAGNTYCNLNLTDGFIPASALLLLSTWAKLPLEASAQAIASRLVEHCFWHIAPGGFMVHDYLDWNMSRADVMALREARAQAGKRGGESSVKAREALAQANALANAQATAQAKRKQVSKQSSSNINIDIDSTSTNVEVPDPLVERHKAIMEAYRKAVGYKLVTEPAENKAAQTLARNTDYTPEQIVACYKSMKADEFWRYKHLGLATIAKNVGAFVEGQKHRSNGNGAATKPYQQSTLQVLKGRESREYVEPSADELARAQAEWDAAPTGAQLRARA